MVYESDFYTTRRPYRYAPSYSTYTTSTPRHYVVRDSPDRSRRAAEEVYSYSYSSNVESNRSTDPYYSRPTSRSYSSSESVARSSAGGPSGYSYNVERSSRTRGDGPGGYSSSYSSTTSGRLPGGTTYRHYSYRTVPSRQVRVLPGLGKVHIVHTYDRIVPYVGHKRLTVVTTPPKVHSARPSILQREYDWIENRMRPWVAYSATNNYLNSNSAVRIVFNRYPSLLSDSFSSSSLYRRYGPVSQYTYDSDWPYLSPYWRLRRPYYTFIRRFCTTPLYSSLHFDTWYDRYIDWCLNYWPKYTKTDYEISVQSPRRYYWHWPRYYPNSRMVYVRNTLPISDYTNYYRIYRPIYNDYYWPYASLNYLSSWWPRKNYLYLDDDDLSYRSLRMQRIFDDETRMIRAQTASLLRSIHLPVPRIRRQPITALNRYGEYPARLSNDHYIHRFMQISPKNSKVEYITYYTEPIKKYIGQGHLSCVSYVGDRGVHGRRRNVYIYEDPVKSDIQLLSFYINKFREEKKQKAIEPTKVPLSPTRPSRRFNSSKQLSDETPQEIKDLREARAARLARINAEEKPSVEDTLKEKQKREEARLAEEKRLAEEQAAKEAQEIKEKKERAAKEAAERAAELERQAELLRQEELAKQAELERARKEEEEQQRLEEERRLAEEAKAEEERKQLIRLQEIAKQAEEEREAELARQAEELAELARQEAELVEQAKKEAEAEELARKEKELAEQKRLEEELAELERQEKELTEAAEKAKQESEVAAQEETQDQILTESTQAESENIQNEQEEKIEQGNDEQAAGEESGEILENVQDENVNETEVVQQVEESQDSPVVEEPSVEEPAVEAAVEEEEEPIAVAEDAPATQEDTADEAEVEEEE